MEVKKFKKEYDRRIRDGKNKFYCNISCASKANPSLVENARIKKENPREAYLLMHKYYKPRKKDELSPFRSYLRKMKQRIKSFCGHRNCDISAQDLKDVWDKQKGICPYTGIEMKLKEYTGPSCPYNGSIDRIDSSKNYSKDNIEYVCLSVNYAKNEFSKDEMLKFFQSVKQYP